MYESDLTVEAPGGSRIYNIIGLLSGNLRIVSNRTIFASVEASLFPCPSDICIPSAMLPLSLLCGYSWVGHPTCDFSVCHHQRDPFPITQNDTSVFLHSTSIRPYNMSYRLNSNNPLSYLSDLLRGSGTTTHHRIRPRDGLTSGMGN